MEYWTSPDHFLLDAYAPSSCRPVRVRFQTRLVLAGHVTPPQSQKLPPSSHAVRLWLLRAVFRFGMPLANLCKVARSLLFDVKEGPAGTPAERVYGSGDFASARSKIHVKFATNYCVCNVHMARFTSSAQAQNTCGNKRCQGRRWRMQTVQAARKPVCLIVCEIRR